MVVRGSDWVAKAVARFESEVVVDGSDGLEVDLLQVGCNER